MNLLLAALGKDIKPSGRDRWLARCPVHNDKDFAMSITMLNSGKILACCHACGANGEAMYEALCIDKGELSNWSDKNQDYISPKMLEELTEDRRFMLNYNRAIDKGDKLAWVDIKRHKLAVARIAGIEAKFGDRI